MSTPIIQLDNTESIVDAIRTLRQARHYSDRKVPTSVIDQLLDVARWSGSGRNVQPWHFIVINDPQILQQISQLRTPINWVADAPLAIGIVLDGTDEVTEAYDEGRLTERVLLAARVLGLGGGIAWFGDESQVQSGKEILGIPAEKTARSVIAIGYPTSTKDTRPNANIPGRKPLTELVSRNSYEGPGS